MSWIDNHQLRPNNGKGTIGKLLTFNKEVPLHYTNMTVVACKSLKRVVKGLIIDSFCPKSKLERIANAKLDTYPVRATFL